MSDLISLCILRLEVCEQNEPNVSGECQSQSPGTDDAGDKHSSIGDQRVPRTINVETFPNRVDQVEQTEWNLLPAAAAAAAAATTTGDVKEDGPVASGEEDEQISFFSGNPFVEVTKGTIHLYKEDALRKNNSALCICLLGVPATLSCHDLLAFTAPCHADIAHIRVLRDPAPNQYLALLTFRAHSAAAQFRAAFDGVPYSGLEPERVCRAVWVSRVEWTARGMPPPPGHTELPTCPVCLERMDESVDGVLTILCNHAFHAGCLGKWGDATCPVCRCVQSPGLLDEGGSECSNCPTGSGVLSHPSDSLWICLVCGNVGCGRYQGGHAARHYVDTAHCYALQLGSHRVWDYKGDNFVHRLLQNKADGKLVPVEGHAGRHATADHVDQLFNDGAIGGNGGDALVAADDKIDAVQLEYTYLLTSQLDSQRRYFEDRLLHAAEAATAERDGLQTRLAQLQAEQAGRLKEQRVLERRVTQLTHKLTLAQTELSDERQLGKALRSNQQHWQTRIALAEQKYAQLKATSGEEIAQLKDQLRDLMFYLEAQQTIAGSENKDDIAGGTIVIPASATTGPPEPPTAVHQQHHKSNKSRNRKKK